MLLFIARHSVLLFPPNSSEKHGCHRLRELHRRYYGHSSDSFSDDIDGMPSRLAKIRHAQLPNMASRCDTGFHVFNSRHLHLVFAHHCFLHEKASFEKTKSRHGGRFGWESSGWDGESRNGNSARRGPSTKSMRRGWKEREEGRLEGCSVLVWCPKSQFSSLHAVIAFWDRCKR